MATGAAAVPTVSTPPPASSDTLKPPSAALVETVNINLEQFSDNFLSCPVCCHTYDQHLQRAKLLPCSHSVCLPCLEKLVAMQAHPQEIGGRCTLNCPLCRSECAVPAGGVSSLPASFLINQLLDLMQRQRKDVVPTCSLHSDQPQLYCEQCDSVFCPNCPASATNRPCREHTVIPLSVALKRMSEIILYRARASLRAFESAAAAIQSEIVHLDRNADRIVEQINSAFQEVSTIVERRRRELLDEVRTRRDSKRAVLRDQAVHINEERTRLERELESGVIDMASVARRARQPDPSALTHPRENAFLRFDSNWSQLICDVEKCVGDFGRLSASTTFPAACKLEMLDVPATHTTTRMKLTTKDLNRLPRTGGGDPVVACLERLLEGDAPLGGEKSEPVGVQLVDHDDGTYGLSFRVSAPGRFRMSVSIFDRQVAGSPVTFDVASRHAPVWNCSAGFRQPTKVVAMNERQGTLLYVLDTGNSRVRVLRPGPACEVVRDIAPACLEGGAVVGLVRADADHLAVLDWRSKAITKFAIADGAVVQSVSFSELREPIDLAVDRRGRFLVADGERVFVFDASLRPLFSFLAGGGSAVTCVAAGLDDDIVVGTSKGVALHDGAGRFLRTIETGDAKSGRCLIGCCVVCASTGLVIFGAVDAKSNKARLSLSTYKGMHSFDVHSIGSPLRRPCGLALLVQDENEDESSTVHSPPLVLAVDHATHAIKSFKYR